MFTKRRIFLVLLFIALFLAFFNLRQNRSLFSNPHLRLIDGVLISFYRPMQKGWALVTDTVQKVWTDYIWLVGVNHENLQLKEELHLSKLAILSLHERVLAEHSQKILLDKPMAFNHLRVLAEVIGYDSFARSQTLWVSAGEKQGVQVDQAVMAKEGLVGRVIKVFPETSQILLLVDPHFAVDVINQSTRSRGLVVGLGQSLEMKRAPVLSQIEFLRIGQAFRPGDLLITSGLNRLYPPSIPVGNILDEELALKAGSASSLSVLPVVDFVRLERVVILKEK